jgi:hypothetical protein
MKTFFSFVLYHLGLLSLGTIYYQEKYEHIQHESWRWWSIMFLTWYFLLHFLNNYKKNNNVKS